MSRYSGYSDSASRKATVDVGETHVTVRQPNGRVVVAIILARKLDANGKLLSILLDRVVHERYGAGMLGWEAHGCFVTELTPEKRKT